MNLLYQNLNFQKETRLDVRVAKPRFLRFWNLLISLIVMSVVKLKKTNILLSVRICFQISVFVFLCWTEKLFGALKLYVSCDYITL